jgi:hypothetical protein
VLTPHSSRKRYCRTSRIGSQSRQRRRSAATSGQLVFLNVRSSRTIGHDETRAGRRLLSSNRRLGSPDRRVVLCRGMAWQEHRHFHVGRETTDTSQRSLNSEENNRCPV